MAASWTLGSFFPASSDGKSLVPYRQRSASMNLQLAMEVVRSGVETAISMRRSHLSRYFVFSLSGFLPFLLVATDVVLHQVSIRTLYEPLALCRLGSSRRRDAASLQSASLRVYRRAQSSGRGVVATVERLCFKPLLRRTVCRPPV